MIGFLFGAKLEDVLKKPDRPLIRYHGGKWLLAPWIISHFPEHKIYVEPFGGAASCLIQKKRSYAEIYNDMDEEIVNLFIIAREHGEELTRLLELTPFARKEFEQAYQRSDDPLEQARRTVIRAFMGFGSSAVTKGRNVTKKFSSPTTGFRANSNRSGTTPAHDWASYPDSFKSIINRLRGVIIENRPAIEIIKQHDSEETLVYCDPPYVSESRDKGVDYVFEMTTDDHIELSEVLHQVESMVILSGYHSDLYDELYKDFRRIERKAFADGARERIEVLWLSPNVPAIQQELF